MRPRQAIASSLHLFAVLAFFAAGFFFFSLPYLPELRIRIADILLSRFEFCTTVAFGFLLAALLLLVGFYGLNRGRILRIEMGRHLASVDVDVIRLTLEECFKRNFPAQVSLTDVEVISAKKLEIGVTIAPINEEMREELFVNAERALQTLLKERFGYRKPFYLIVKSKDF